MNNNKIVNINEHEWFELIETQHGRSINHYKNGSVKANYAERNYTEKSNFNKFIKYFK